MLNIISFYFIFFNICNRFQIPYQISDFRFESLQCNFLIYFTLLNKVATQNKHKYVE